MGFGPDLLASVPCPSLLSSKEVCAGSKGMSRTGDDQAITRLHPEGGVRMSHHLAISLYGQYGQAVCAAQRELLDGRVRRQSALVDGHRPPLE